MPGYLSATRHPWASFLFLVPLLVAYEVGVLALGGSQPDTLRNGADVWLRQRLVDYGLVFAWAAPAVVLLGLFVHSWWNWSNRPREPITTVFGMTIESVVFAAILWAFSRNFQGLLNQTGLPLNSVQFHRVAEGQVVNFIGAGIYEEFLFRLGLFSLLYYLLRLLLLPKLVAIILGALASALFFSAAHHLGTGGESMDASKFLFRTAAGLIFTAIYLTRGLGIAAGAHAGYNILVGVSVE
jgi:hypothetical protein